MLKISQLSRSGSGTLASFGDSVIKKVGPANLGCLKQGPNVIQNNQGNSERRSLRSEINRVLHGCSAGVLHQPKKKNNASVGGY